MFVLRQSMWTFAFDGCEYLYLPLLLWCVVFALAPCIAIKPIEYILNKLFTIKIGDKEYSDIPTEPKQTTIDNILEYSKNNQ